MAPTEDRTIDSGNRGFIKGLENFANERGKRFNAEPERDIWMPGDGENKSLNKNLGKGNFDTATARAWKTFEPNIDPIPNLPWPALKNTKISGKAGYMVVHLMSRKNWSDNHGYDFTVDGNIKVSRVPHGDPIIAKGSGRFFFLVYRGYYALFGEKVARHHSWVIRPTNGERPLK